MYISTCTYISCVSSISRVNTLGKVLFTLVYISNELLCVYSDYCKVYFTVKSLRV